MKTHAREAGLLERRGRVLYCGIDLLLMLLLLLRAPSLTGAAVFVVLGALLCLRVLVGPAGREPAGGALAFILFVDALLLVGIHFDTLRAAFDPFGALAEHQSFQWVPLLLGGVAAGVLGLLLPRLRSLAFLGAAAVGSAVILRAFGGGALSPEQAGCGVLLAAFLAGVAIWLYTAQVTLEAAPRSSAAVHLLGVLLLFGAVALFLTETALVASLAVRVVQWLLAVGATTLAPWRVALCAFVLGGAAVSLYDTSRKCIGPDALLLASGAGWALLLWAVSAWYVPLGWLSLVLYGWVVCYALQNELYGRKTLGLANERVLGAALLALLLLLRLIHIGLWPLAAVAAVFGIILHSEHGRARSDARADFRWLLALCAIAAVAVAWVWKLRFAEETVWLLLLLFLFAALAMSVLALPHPHDRRAPARMRAAVCVVLALLCLLPMSRGGVKVAAQADPDLTTVRVGAAARGRDNAVADLVYYWSDRRGNRLDDEPRPLPPDGREQEIELEAACLTVIATDASGIRTVHTSFFPCDFARFAEELLP